MEHKYSHLMIGYWSSLRRGRTAPVQSDIEPRSISRVLSTVFILDASNRSNPTYRLAGTALCHRFGAELRGKSFLAHWETSSSKTLGWLLGRALKLHRPVCLRSIDCCLDAAMVELETVLAPISTDDFEPTRFIGMAQILGQHSAHSRLSGAFQSLSESHLITEAELTSTSSTSLSQLSFAKYPSSVHADDMG